LLFISCLFLLPGCHFYGNLAYLINEGSHDTVYTGKLSSSVQSDYSSAGTRIADFLLFKKQAGMCFM
jgi:hypothetical protein